MAHTIRSLLLAATLPTVLSAALATPTRAMPQEDPGRLWGRVTTVDGAAVEGFLRWDLGQGVTADLLTGLRAVTEEGLEVRRELAEADSADRRRSVEILGYRVTWKEDPERDAMIESGVRFGWIERLRPDGNEAELDLGSGHTVRLRISGSGLGRGVRRVDIEQADGEKSTVRWGRIREVVLLSPPRGVRSAAARIHGTVTASGGQTFTGWITWDADEAFLDERLDADEGTIPFSRLERIERASEGARVTLRSGERRLLTGSNDVDDDNRGIQISDPALGRATVNWEEFVALDLHPAEVGPEPFTGGGPIRGRVTTESGAVHAGRVLWDLDEGFDWQLLNGYAEGVEVDIEFSRITRIAKAPAGTGAVVTLRDGRTLRLEGSNDVDVSNRGLLVVDEAGERHVVDWAGFSALDLEAR